MVTPAVQRALFIGCGGAATGTAAKFLREPGTEIVGLVDPVPGAAARLNVPSHTPAFPDLAAALRVCDANLAFIASPNAVHAEQFIACVERDWHVWIEKPVALSLDEAQAMQRAAAGRPIKLMTPYMCEQDPYLADAVAAVRAGSLGALVQVLAVRMGSNGFFSQGFGGHRAVLHPEISGGWIHHHLCHVVDWALCLGGRARAVTCATHSTVPQARPDSGHEEAVTCMLAFEAGGTACLMENQLRYKYHRYAVVGARGGIFMEHHPKAQPGQAMVRIDTEIDGQTARRTLTPADYVVESTTRASPVQRFLQAIEHDLPSPMSMDRHIQVLSVCLALIASAAQRGEWVDVASPRPAAVH